MLSIDKTLLGEQGAGKFGISGDTVARHKAYGTMVDKIDIIVTSPPGYEHTQLSENVDVYPTNSRTIWGHFKSMRNYAQSLMEHDGFDVIVAQDLTGPVARVLRRAYGAPYLISTHAESMESKDFKKNFRHLLNPVIKQSLKNANGLRVVSDGVKKYYQAQGVACPIVVIPTAQNYGLFAKLNSETAKVKEKYKGQQLLLTDGRLVSVKNYPLLFEATKELRDTFKDVRLLVIGSGPLELKLKTLAKKLGLEKTIEFLGNMPYEHIVPFYQACDLFVLASDSESLGKVLIQAGFAGKACVATKTSGAESIIEDNKTGFLVEKNNKAELVEKISSILKDASLGKSLGESARELVTQKYDSEKNIKQFVDFWKKIAESSVKPENNA